MIHSAFAPSCSALSRARATPYPPPSRRKPSPSCSSGRDLLGAAQTGTGKTAGFALPLLQRLAEKSNTGSHSPARHPVRALIVTPTRELAAQVEEDVRTYGNIFR